MATNHNTRARRSLQYVVKSIGVLTIINAFVLAFSIQETNLTASLAANVYNYSTVPLSCYLFDLILLIGGSLLVWLANREGRSHV